MSADFHWLSLIEKKEIAEFTTQFVFSTGNADYSFLPGQYVSVQLDIDGRKDTRDFSIASSPLKKDKIMIVTKKGISDFKRKLFELEVGDIVEVSSPKGGFILDTNDNIPQVFIAGGIGITPFYSMMQYSAANKSQKSLTLLVSFSRAEDVIFHEELLKVQKDFSNIKIIYSLSSPMEAWHGERGRIDKEMIKKYIPDLQAPVYYIVGKVEMVDDIYAMLRELEVPQEMIKIEYYTGY